MMQPFEPPAQSADDLSLDVLRIPERLRGSYVLVVLSAMSFVAMIVTLLFAGIVGGGAAPVGVMFPLLGVALACGALVSSLQTFQLEHRRNRPLAAFAASLAVLELLGWLTLCAGFMMVMFA